MKLPISNTYINFSHHSFCCFTVVPLLFWISLWLKNRCLQHLCFKNLCKIAQAAKNSDSNAQHFLLDSLTHSWFHSMLFALPSYQFPYITNSLILSWIGVSTLCNKGTIWRIEFFGRYLHTYTCACCQCKIKSRLDNNTSHDFNKKMAGVGRSWEENVGFRIGPNLGSVGFRQRKCPSYAKLRLLFDFIKVWGWRKWDKDEVGLLGIWGSWLSWLSWGPIHGSQVPSHLRSIRAT
jgi:hypothetical protein